MPKRMTAAIAAVTAASVACPWKTTPNTPPRPGKSTCPHFSAVSGTGYGPSGKIGTG